MKAWLLLACAIVLEVTASLSLSAAQQRPGWVVVVVLGYLGAFAALSRVLRTGFPLGVAYGVWGAAGVALTALFATVLLGDPLTLPTTVGMALVIGGVLLVEIGSHRSARHASASATRSGEANA